MSPCRCRRAAAAGAGRTPAAPRATGTTCHRRRWRSGRSQQAHVSGHDPLDARCRVDEERALIIDGRRGPREAPAGTSVLAARGTNDDALADERATAAPLVHGIFALCRAFETIELRRQAREE